MSTMSHHETDEEENGFSYEIDDEINDTLCFYLFHAIYLTGATQFNHHLFDFLRLVTVFS